MNARADRLTCAIQARGGVVAGRCLHVPRSLPAQRADLQELISPLRGGGAANKVSKDSVPS